MPHHPIDALPQRPDEAIGRPSPGLRLQGHETAHPPHLTTVIHHLDTQRGGEGGGVRGGREGVGKGKGGGMEGGKGKGRRRHDNKKKGVCVYLAVSYGGVEDAWRGEGLGVHYMGHGLSR